MSTTNDSRLIYQVAKTWVEGGGDADGITWCWMDIREAVIEIITEMENDDLNGQPMSTPINDGGPAFPNADTVYPNGQVQYGATGMTLRDYFAAHESLDDFNGKEIPLEFGIQLAGPHPSVLPKEDCVAWLKWQAKARASLRYIRADAMIAARERKSE